MEKQTWTFELSILTNSPVRFLFCLTSTSEVYHANTASNIKGRLASVFKIGGKLTNSLNISNMFSTYLIDCDQFGPIWLYLLFTLWMCRFFEFYFLFFALQLTLAAGSCVQHQLFIISVNPCLFLPKSKFQMLTGHIGRWKRRPTDYPFASQMMLFIPDVIVQKLLVRVGWIINAHKRSCRDFFFSYFLFACVIF